MKKQLFYGLFSALVLSACHYQALSYLKKKPEADAFRLVDVRTSGAANEISIPYKKYILQNGLTVILHEDKSDPLVHVDVTYHVGSGREDVGKSGFAHFFEHMLFQGSENVADEQHFKIVTESGGTLNGSTNSDRTNYYQTVPSNQLERILWLEADRMGYFLNAVTAEKFEVQRETVKNERGQRVDNQPYGLLWERVGEAQFPEGHPYSWSTIGYIEDLNRATLDDLKRFFLRWYGPNNATLSIGGDFDEAQTLAWVEKYFGPIKRGPDIEKPTYVPVILPEERYISLEDNVQLPLLYLSWPTVHLKHPDEAPLDVLMNIMGGGKTSLLYKNLEKPGLAVQTNAGHGCRELSCSFSLYALANPERINSLADIEAIIRKSLDEFEQRGVHDDDLARVKATIVSGMIYGLESVAGKVSQLTHYETYYDDPDGIEADIKRYESVTKADVMRAYRQYIKDKPAVIMSIVPKGERALIAHEDSWQRYTRTMPDAPPAVSVDWSPPLDNFDRSVIPSAGDNPNVKVPEIYRTKLGQHITLFGALNPETPTTSLQIRIKAGQNYEPLDKIGLASLTAAMMEEATKTSTAEMLSNRLAKLGSSVSFDSYDSYSSLNIRSLTKHLDETVMIALEQLLSPKFSEADFVRVKGNRLQAIQAAKKQPDVVADAIFHKLLYGQQNAFAYSNEGLESTIEAITLQDIKDFYHHYYSPEITSVIGVSNLNEPEILQALAPLKAWSGQTVIPPAVAGFPELAGGTLYFVNKAGAAQSEIRIGKRALPFDATGEFYRANLMNYPLGGAFNSRINLNLRENKGYTYGAGSRFLGHKFYGHYRARAGVRTDASAASIIEFVKEIDLYRTEGITAEELSFTKNAIGQRDARAYETPRQKLNFLGRMLTYDLSPDFVDVQARILEYLTKAEVDKLAHKHLQLKDMIMVVVGDKAEIFSDLEDLGYPIVELGEEGEVIEQINE